MALVSSINFTGNTAHVSVTRDECAVSSRHVVDELSTPTSSEQIQRAHTPSLRSIDSNQSGALVNARLSKLDISGSDSQSECDDSQFPLSVTARNKVFCRPFYEKSPETYFLAVEIDFKLAGIVNQSDKFAHVWKTLEDKHLRKIGSDLPAHAPPTCYDDLKRVLIQQFSPTPAEKFADLCENLRHGMPPQDVKDKIKNAFGSKSEDSHLEDFKRELFLRHIPERIAFTLRAFVDDSLEKTVYRATVMYSALPSGIAKGQAQSTDTFRSGEPQKLPQQSNEVEKPDPNLQSAIKSDTVVNSKPTNRQTKIGFTLGSRPKVSFPDQSPLHSSRRQKIRQHRFPGYGLSDRICYYHSRFGFSARNCRKPCVFNSDVAPFDM